MSKKDWSKPMDIDDVTNAFPAGVGHLMPTYRELRDMNIADTESIEKMSRIVGNWFFAGLPQETKFTPRDGVDKSKALRHVNTVMRSFEPKHEHKELGCAFLLDQFFSDIDVPKKAMDEQLKKVMAR